MESFLGRGLMKQCCRRTGSWSVKERDWAGDEDGWVFCGFYSQEFAFHLVGEFEQEHARQTGISQRLPCFQCAGRKQETSALRRAQSQVGHENEI